MTLTETETRQDNRVVVSDLMNYLWFREHEQPLHAYLDRLLRRDPISPEQARGQRLHEGLQLLALDLKDTAAAVLGEFDWSSVDHDIVLSAPSSVELPVRRMYEVGGRNVLLAGRVDAIARDIVYDYKTGKRIDLEALHDSLQWRAYLDMRPLCTRFKYEVFQLASKEWKVLDHVSFEVRAYRQMHEHVAAAVEELDWFLQQLQADGHIELDPDGGGVVRSKRKV